MPVMIKVNEATECGVTNGAEGEIVGWTSRPISEDQFALDTLFVKLTAAPTSIKLPGLPDNVVPLSHQTKEIKCKLLNGMVLEGRGEKTYVGKAAMDNPGNRVATPGMETTV